MTALETLTAHYEDPGPAVEPWLGRVVGCLGADIPRELVAAAGLLPLRLRGTGPPEPIAEAILGPRIDPPVRRVLAALLRGVLPIDFLLLCHDTDGSVRLFDALRVLARDDPPPRLPETWFVDLLHLPTDTTARYDLDRLQELRSLLGRWGQPVTEESLRDSIREANRTRALLAGIAGLRRSLPPLLTGAEALAVFGATTMLPADEANALLEELLVEERPAPPIPARRVYVTGSSHDSTEFYRAIESDGSIVVGEDHDWGEAIGEGLISEDGDPLDEIAAHYRSRSAAALRTHTNARAAHVAREAGLAGADVVVAWIRTGDDALGWGLPALSQALESTGIRLVTHEQKGPWAEDAAELGLV